ncbi:MAG: hydroxymethylbilane synthase [Ruminiclostridium sp.]|nr:hydroxymethylbilane synthase [Ruminiclostridium sp.]
MKKIIRVGSRESRLAMVQTEWVISEIRKKHPELEFEITGIKAKGDMFLDDRLDKIGGKGLFVKELENELLSGAIDFAVHSMKDMPAYIPDKLIIAAVSRREDPRDVLVTADGRKLGDLPEGAIIGTSSIRREVQISEKRPDLKFKNLRGNVLTRIKKLLDGEYDALLLAAAGLKRLGLEERCVEYFDTEDVIPAAGQGILAIEAKRNGKLDFLTDSVHDADSFQVTQAERAFLVGLNGGCSEPIAAHAVISGQHMRIYGMLASEDRSRIFRAETKGSKNDAERLGLQLAELILKQRN